MIVRALCGGKSANADYWSHVRHAMDESGFQSCKADPDVWFRPATKANGIDCYQYVFIYTDDILAIMKEPKRFLRDWEYLYPERRFYQAPYSIFRK